MELPDFVEVAKTSELLGVGGARISVLGGLRAFGFKGSYIGYILGLYGENGKENGNYYNGLYRVYTV